MLETDNRQRNLASDHSHLKHKMLCCTKEYSFINLQALSNLTGDLYRAHCSINRVPKFKYEQYLQDCGYSLSSER